MQVEKDWNSDPSTSKGGAQTMVAGEPSFVRPQKWEDSQVGFRGSNPSGRRVVLLPGAFF